MNNQFQVYDASKRSGRLHCPCHSLLTWIAHPGPTDQPDLSRVTSLVLVPLSQCFKKHRRAHEKPQSRVWCCHSLEYGGWCSHGAAVPSNAHDWLADLPKSHRYDVVVVLSDGCDYRDSIGSSTTSPSSASPSASMSTNSYNSNSLSRDFMHVL